MPATLDGDKHKNSHCDAAATTAADHDNYCTDDHDNDDYSTDNHDNDDYHPNNHNNHHPTPARLAPVVELRTASRYFGTSQWAKRGQQPIRCRSDGRS